MQADKDTRAAEGAGAHGSLLMVDIFHGLCLAAVSLKTVTGVAFKDTFILLLKCPPGDE